MRALRWAAPVLIAAALLLCALGVLTAPGRPAPAAYRAGALPSLPPVEAIPRQSGWVDVNHGEIPELVELPGIGETLAQAIIDERESRGPFRYPEDLLSVRGIGEKKLAGFRDMLDLTAEAPEE